MVFRSRLGGMAAAVLLALSGLAADWPMWQHDAGRTAAGTERLGDRLELLWTLPLPALEPCWEDVVNQDRMPFDSQYEPVVAGGVMVLASNRDDSVAAYDLASGRERWRVSTEGPVRFAPVLHEGRVHAVSDDGWLYTWGLDDGALLWRMRGGRDDRRVLGNRRLVSAWCARGGPVLLDGILYFGAGIWPFMGTAIHAVDPASGRTIWTQGMLGELYVKQPHAGAESFGAVAPQGAFAAAGDRLVVPNGRSVPAVLRRLDGELMHFHLDGTTLHTVGGSIDRKIEGGSYVCTDGRFLINHRGVSTALYDVDSGNAYLAWPGRNHPVLADGVLYLGSATVRALPLDGLALAPYEVTVTDKQTGEKRSVTRQRWELPAAWELEVDASGALMRSGDRLYAAGKDRLTAIDLTRTPPAVVWSAPAPGSVVRLLAASGRLVAVTAEGPIHVFGEAAVAAGVAGAPAAPVLAPAVVPVPVPAPSRAARHRLARLTDGLPLPEGWALVYDPPDAATLEALLTHPGLSLVAVVADPAQAAGLRAYFRARGIYGTRISVHAGTIAGYQAPPYVAQLVLVCQPAAAADPANLRQLFAAVRPYGGRLFLLGRAARLRRLMRPHSLPGSRWVDQSNGLLIERPGPLPGSAPWTHLYGSAANTAKSDESLVRAPLGLLWFGGNSHADVLPRHGHGPSEQVIRGRLFIQGIDSLSARDVYTGTTLWKRTFSDLGTEGIYYDSSYCEDPLDLTYNQRHIPGANARGTNFVATADRLYLLAGGDCLVLDPADGRTLATFALPPDAPGGAAPAWGYIGVAGDVIVGGTGFSAFSQAHDIEKGGVMDDFDVSSSRGLAAFDRHSGALLWTRPARLGFRHNAVCLSDDTLYCIDALPSLVTDRLKRRGLNPTAEPEILALDLRTGAERWRRREGVFGTWLGVAADRGVLIQGGRPSRDALKDEPADRLMALNCRTGEVLWDREGRYGGPCMLHGETIYSSATSTSGGAFSLRTGEPLTRPHPLTRLPVPWTYHRRYGCNAVVASEHLLTFRSGAAGYYDLISDSGTANLGGFKSGCTSNLIAADGVLNAPDYTRTCTCSYQNQTSLALIHMPDLDVWTANDVPRGPGRILDLAVNLGAPGDRRDEQGNLWFDFPAVGGPSPSLPVTVTDAGCRWYAFPTHTAAGPEAWIAASGIEGEATLAVDLITDDERYTIRRLEVAGPADDAEEAEGAVIQGSTDLEMVRDQKDQVVGLRFLKVDLRPEDPLADAFLCFTADEASTEVTEVVLRAQAAASAPGFTRDREDLSRRPLTTAEVRWIIPPWPSVGAAGPAQRSPDVAPLLREIVSRPDWVPGGAVVFIITGHGRRAARAAENAAGGAAVLELRLAKTAAEIAAQAATAYRLRLVVAEPSDVPPGRVFDVLVQGQPAVTGWRLEGQPRRAVWLDLGRVLLRDRLEVALRASPGSGGPPVLSGLILQAEGAPP